MIYDSLKTIEKYKGINELLDEAIDFIANNKLDQLPDGRTEINGDLIYVNVVDSKLIPENEGQYEYHESYIDIHIDIVGSEKILLSEFCGFQTSKEYDCEKDCAFGLGRKTAECALDNNHFCICMPEEPHMPCVGEKAAAVRKAIFKVRYML